MAQQLEIDGAVYEPSTAIAAAFGYTADYVSKLAREGKVLAQQVGRTWYVDRNSFELFSTEADSQKLARRERLRTERKFERASRSASQIEQVRLPHPNVAVGHAFAAVAILVMTLSLGLVSLTEDVRPSDLVYGGQVVAEDMSAAFSGITPDSQTALLGWFWEFWNSRSNQGVQSTERLAGAAATTSDSVRVTGEAGLVILDGASDETVINGVRAQFSDPVEVDFDSRDSGLIKPVFKEGHNESYRFLMVPVVSTETE